MNNEIYYGLKNALERGDSLESAVQSFINAGYNPMEVRRAGKMLSGDSAQLGEKEELDNSGVKPLPQSEVVQEIIIGKKKSNNGKRVFMIGLIIILMLMILGGLGFLIFYFLE